MTKREELARAYSERFSPGYWEYQPDDERWRQGCFDRVDWFLDELMEPGDGALESCEILEGIHSPEPAPLIELWQTILTHIREGK